MTRMRSTGNSTGLTFDEALTRQLRKAGWSRREFLARVAAFGAATALTQLLIACGPAGSSAAPATARKNSLRSLMAHPRRQPRPTAPKRQSGPNPRLLGSRESLPAEASR